MKKLVTLLMIVARFHFTGYCQLNYNDHKNLLVLLQREDYNAITSYMDYKGYDVVDKRFNLDLVSRFIVAEIKYKKYFKTWNQKGIYYPYDEITIKIEDEDDIKHYSLDQILYSETDFESFEQTFLKEVNKENWTFCDFYKLVTANRNQDFKIMSAGKLVSYQNIKLLGTELENINSAIYDKLLKPSENYNILHLLYDQRDSIELFLSNQNTNIGPDKFFIYSKMKFPKQINLKFTAYVNMFSTNINFSKTESNVIKTHYLPLINRGANYYLYVIINKVKKMYILDSGASDMSLDEGTYEDLKQNAIVTSQNQLASEFYKLADGSSIKLRRTIIPRISFDNLVVSDIPSCIVKNNTPLLLGKSFLDKFKSWKIDTKKTQLILEDF